jgi:hypothetical protein
MSLARRLISLYPTAFRERWGPDLEVEVQAAGGRSWPNLAAGVAGMWLHPALWPAGSRSQRRGRAATTAAVLTAGCWYLIHAAVELDERLGRDLGHSWQLSACTVMMLVGLALVSPRPDLATAVAGLRLLAVPTLLGGLVVIAANSGASLGAARYALPACWWIALALCAVQVCRVVARHGVPPSEARLRLGMWTLALASGATGAVVLGLSAAGGDFGAPAVLVAAGLLVPASAYIWTLRDLDWGR